MDNWFCVSIWDFLVNICDKMTWTDFVLIHRLSLLMIWGEIIDKFNYLVSKFFQMGMAVKDVSKIDKP